MGESRKAWGRGIATAYVEDMCKKAGRTDLLTPKTDWDGLFQSITKSLSNKCPIKMDYGDLEDIMVEAMEGAITVRAVSEFNPDRSDKFSAWLGSLMKNKILNVLAAFINKNKKLESQAPGDTKTQEQWLDSRHSPDKQEPEIHYRDLVNKLNRYLLAKQDGKYCAMMLQMYLDGASSQEIADKAHVSKGLISRYLQRLKEYILDFAEETDNDTLYSIMQDRLHSRRHSLHFSADEGDFFREVFELYRRKVGSMKTANSYDVAEERVRTLQKMYGLGRATEQELLAAKKALELAKKDQDKEMYENRPSRHGAGFQMEPNTKIHKMVKDDVLAEKNMADLVLSDKVSQAAIDTTAEDFLNFCANAGDLIEIPQTGKIVGLSIQTDQVRNIPEEAQRQSTRFSKVASDPISSKEEDSSIKTPSPDAEFADTDDKPS